jgi:alkylhydroperoxidase family enzyme
VTRIPLVDPDDPSVAPEIREILGEWGNLRNVVLALANHEGALEAIRSLSAAGYSTGERRDRRELAYLTASVVNRCHY